jgi:hypothetical protein
VQPAASCSLPVSCCFSSSWPIVPVPVPVPVPGLPVPLVVTRNLPRSREFVKRTGQQSAPARSSINNKSSHASTRSAHLSPPPTTTNDTRPRSTSFPWPTAEVCAPRAAALRPPCNPAPHAQRAPRKRGTRSASRDIENVVAAAAKPARRTTRKTTVVDKGDHEGKAAPKTKKKAQNQQQPVGGEYTPLRRLYASAWSQPPSRS